MIHPSALRILSEDKEYMASMKFLSERTKLREQKWALFDQDRLVYFAYNQCLIKIGSSIDPEQRIKMFRTANPYIILLFSCPGGSLLESELHREFKADRIKGEWFLDNDKLRNRMEGLGWKQ